jgi:hypothetical protein
MSRRILAALAGLALLIIVATVPGHTSVDAVPSARPAPKLHGG